MYRICSNSARSSFSGGIDGRPVQDYIWSKRRESLCSASSVSRRMTRRGWSLRTPLLQAEVAEHRVLMKILSSHRGNNTTHLCFYRKCSDRDFFSTLLGGFLGLGFLLTCGALDLRELQTPDRTSRKPGREMKEGSF